MAICTFYCYYYCLLIQHSVYTPAANTQVSQARCLCYSANLARINSLCVYSWPSHCVSLRTRFLQGSMVTTMQCLKNSAWTETMNMRLSGVTITFFFFANLQGSIAIAIICLKKGIVLSSHSFHCGCRAGLNILPIQKGFLTQGNICMACVRYLTCLCGSCRARQYTSIYMWLALIIMTWLMTWFQKSLLLVGSCFDEIRKFFFNLSQILWRNPNDLLCYAYALLNVRWAKAI